MSQLVFKFPFKTTYYEKDFFVSSSNFEAYKLIESWPKWSSKQINIFGPSGCGKTHLINILSKKSKLFNSSFQYSLSPLELRHAIDLFLLLSVKSIQLS